MLFIIWCQLFGSINWTGSYYLINRLELNTEKKIYDKALLIYLVLNDMFCQLMWFVIRIIELLKINSIESNAI